MYVCTYKKAFSKKNADEVEVSGVMNNHYLSTDLEAKSEARVWLYKYSPYQNR